MSLWQFSESSQPLLKLCIDAAKGENNSKWLTNFKHCIPVEDHAEPVVIAEENVEINQVLSLQSSQTSIINEKCEISDDAWREIIELDPVENFNLIVEKYLDNSALYSKLAQNLPLQTIEKFCNHIFGCENCNTIFVDKFFNIFLPVFLKRDQTRLSLNILLNAEKYNRVLFKSLLELLLKDIELPSLVLQEYLSYNNNYNVLMNDIITFDISNEVFLHHLHTIHIIYKNCQKNDIIQSFILSKLIDSSHACQNDKNYGRLLLNYIQEQKNYVSDVIIIQKIVDSHRSPFKKPCMNALNELKKLLE